MTNSGPLMTGWSREELVEHAIAHEGAVLSVSGVLSVRTGARTGRSRDARYIVADNTTSTTVNWGEINRPFKRHMMDKIWEKAQQYRASKKLFSSTMQVGASGKYALEVEVKTE